MALSDCSECWETPCVCGKYWKDVEKEVIIGFLVSVVARRTKEEAVSIMETALVSTKNRKEKN